MRFFCFSLLLILFVGCSNSKNKRSRLIDFVPKNAQVVIKSTNLESLKSDLNQNYFLKGLSKTPDHQNLYENLEKTLSHLNPTGEALICLSKDSKGRTVSTFISKHTKTVFQSDSVKNYIEETLSYSNKSIIKSKLEDHTFYSTIVDSVFFLSSSKDIVNGVFEASKDRSGLKKMYGVCGKNENLSVLFKTDSIFAPSFFLEEGLNTAKLADFFILDTEIDQNDIIINGIAKTSDTTKKLLEVFKNTIPKENKMQDITPANSDGFLSITFDDFKKFNSNLHEYRLGDSIVETLPLFENIAEVGVIYEGDKRAIVLRSVDVIATQDALLSEQTKIDTYRDIGIYGFSQPALFSETLSPFITYDNATKYCIVDDFFIFSDSIELLQNIIANHQNKTTLGGRGHYKDIAENLSSESSLVYIVKPTILKKIVKENLGEGQGLKLDNYNLSAVQFIYDTDFSHVNVLVKKKKKSSARNTIIEALNIKLENEALNTPQFVTNHINKQKDIVVQDISNNLHLISNQGEILWKKRLNGPILGSIEQIDMYKNGRLQLVFATSNEVYVLDRKGREVAPFPLKLNNAITQPLSVFDYDKNKKYRLMVTQGKDVLMYDARGKIVKGFNFKSANDAILSQPKHFRVGSKDYLVLKTKHKLYILDRTGKTRLAPKTKLLFSNEPMFLYQNKFTTTTDDGKFISIDTKGHTSEVNLSLSSNHNLETTNKTRVTFHDNKLGIKSRILELDYGDYSRPKIFYINNKIYVSISDLQAKQVFLYDSQGKPRPNFPVYGNSIMDLGNIDKDKNLEFVVKGDGNSILVYEISNSNQ